jgi:TorA-specific chaperone
MQETKAFNEQRAEIYWWLSGIFIRPLTEHELNAYHKPEIRAFLSGLGNHALLKPAADQLITVLSQIETDANAHHSLTKSFNALYLSSDNHAPLASPYASAYVDNPALPARQIIDVMEQKGIPVDSSINEPADHLAVELDLLSNIIIRSNELEKPEHINAALLEQKGFIDTHLLSWLPLFVNQCSEYDTLGFYSNVSSLLLNFCRLDSSYLAGGTTEGNNSV